MDKKPPPAAASIAAAQPTLAEALIAVETLVQVFGFSPEVANEAVNEVGVDVVACSNYILDQGLGEDAGGPVVPVDTCPHIDQTESEEIPSVPLSENALLPVTEWPCCYTQQVCLPDKKPSSNKNMKGTYLPDGTCPLGENWWCWTCHQVFCSRYINGHGLEHWKDTVRHSDTTAASGHCVAISLSDLSVWCHVCQAYVNDHRYPKLEKTVQELRHLKFPEG